jgi:hypothetical protein
LGSYISDHSAKISDKVPKDLVITKA